MKKVVIAPDSFKDCMSSLEACMAIEKAVSSFDNIQSVILPMADGGEGTSSIIKYNNDTRSMVVNVKNALAIEKEVELVVINDRILTVCIEIAAICGLEELSIEQRNPLYTTTYGVGEAIIQSINNGYRNFLITLGGSATNDCGLGMLQALGATIKSDFDSQCFIGKTTQFVEEIDLSTIDPRIQECTFEVACDVTNPLLGENGATYMFSKQKGAVAEVTKVLESGIEKCVALIEKQSSVSPFTAGCGAAGGLGFAFLVVGGKLISGIDLVMKYTDFENKVLGADLIITGEGSIDNQTIKGKTIAGIIKVARFHNIPVIALGGKVDGKIDELYQLGLLSAFSITPSAMPLLDALSQGKKNLTNCSVNVLRTYFKGENNEIFKS